MEPLQLFSLLTVSPGNLIFHLVLVFSISGALQSGFSHWRISGFPQARRTIIGLAILLLVQVFLFVMSGLGWQGIINLRAFLAPLDRAMTLISLIWIIWLWAFPEPNRIADAGAALGSLLVIVSLSFGLVNWAQTDLSIPYNTTLQEFIWQSFSIVFIILGIFTLFVRRPNGWGNGLSVLVLALIGHSLHIVFGRMDGNYPGIVRLLYMAGFPFLLTLPQRFPIPVVSRETSIKKDAPAPERRHFSTDPKTFHTLLALAAETNPNEINRNITRGVAQALLADLCFLIYLTADSDQMMVASGYDLIREENLEGTSMDKNAIPMLTNALQRGRPLRLPASSTSVDVMGLSELLGLNNPGHMMIVPIVTNDKDTQVGVLVLSPYSDRAWRVEDQAFLGNIAPALVPIIQRSQRVAVIEQRKNELEKDLNASRDQVRDLKFQLEGVTKKREALKLEMAKSKTDSQAVLSLTALQQETQQEIERLQKENEEFRFRNTKSDGDETGFMESELRAALAQVARLQNELAEVNMKLVMTEKTADGVQTVEQSEVIASIAQELRQPMSSVIGYTDLLLGESVGILGALQRKFVERIKTSTRRIGSLLDDMIQITNFETGLTVLKPAPVDLNTIIDGAMSYTSGQIREKNITLHLDLPDKLANIFADRDALQQIIIHLLQNAGAATPDEGTITLKVQTQTEEDQEHILVQLTDTGLGIADEDIPRVFQRLYRADNVLIQGLGDTGVGLSIAKKMVEAQNGKIWVESEQGIGSTFSVLLPVAKGD
jgi:signal transduction histidine kinase